MEFVILSAGSESRVKVERLESGYVVEVDGECYEVDHAKAGESQRSLLIAGRQTELSVHRESAGRYRVTTSSGEHTFEVRAPLDHLARISREGSAPGGSEAVTAYMPGRVAAVLVAEGDSVEAGQGIVVLEAMKMENEIQTEIAGTVRKILVEAGQSVEGGDPLFEIEAR